ETRVPQRSSGEFRYPSVERTEEFISRLCDRRAISQAAGATSRSRETSLATKASPFRVATLALREKFAVTHFFIPAGRECHPTPAISDVADVPRRSCRAWACV